MKLYFVEMNFNLQLIWAKGQFLHLFKNNIGGETNVILIIPNNTQNKCKFSDMFISLGQICIIKQLKCNSRQSSKYIVETHTVYENFYLWKYLFSQSYNLEMYNSV